MKTFLILSASVMFSVSLAGQSSNPEQHLPGARLVLAPTEPLTEPRFPRPKGDAAKRESGIRPAILELKPAGDPIYLEEPVPATAGHQLRTYRRPKVEPFSRDGEGLAVQGYDVVSYLGARAEKGRKEFPVNHGGTTWLFASAEHRDLFTKDPERYLPAYGGFCAYSIGKGYPATADPRAFAIDKGRLYLFFDNTVRSVWEQDQGRLILEAAKNWPGLHR